MSNFQAIPGEDIQRLIDHSAVRRAAAEHYKNVIKLNLQAYIKSCEDCIAMYDAVIEAENQTNQYLLNVLKQQIPNKVFIPTEKSELETVSEVVVTEIVEPQSDKKKKRTDNLNGKHHEQSSNSKE